MSDSHLPRFILSVATACGVGILAASCAPNGETSCAPAYVLGLGRIETAWATLQDPDSPANCGAHLTRYTCNDGELLMCSIGTFQRTTLAFDRSGDLIAMESEQLAGPENFSACGEPMKLSPNDCVPQETLSACTMPWEDYCAQHSSECPKDVDSAWAEWSASGHAGSLECKSLSLEDCGQYKIISCLHAELAGIGDRVWYFDAQAGGVPVATRTIWEGAACDAGPAYFNFSVPDACSRIDERSFPPAVAP